MPGHGGRCWTAETSQTPDITFNPSVTPMQVILVWLLDYERTDSRCDRDWTWNVKSLFGGSRSLRDPPLSHFIYFFHLKKINIFILCDSCWNRNATERTIKTAGAGLRGYISCVCLVSFHTCIKNRGPFSPWILIPYKLWSQLFAYFWAPLVLTESTWLLLLLLSPQCSQRGKKIDASEVQKFCFVFFLIFWIFFQIYPTLLWELWGLDSAAGQWSGGVMVGLILKDILGRVSRRHLRTKGCQCPTWLSRKSTLGCLISKIQQWTELFFFYSDF